MTLASKRPFTRALSILALASLLAACTGTSPRSANSAGGAGAGAATGGAGGHGGHGGAGNSGAPSTGGAGATSAGGNGGTPGCAAVDGGDLAPAVTARFPAADATSVCVDPPLRLDFSAPVTLGTCGKIQVFSDADPTTPVDVIDMAAQTSSITVSGRAFVVLRPVYLEGQTAVITLKPHSLSANQTYFVTVDPTVFLDASGAPLGPIEGNTAWRFTTGSGVPADAASINVALDGSGDFCSLQGALDVVPPNGTTPVTIHVKNGTYHELILFMNKANLTISGEDRKQTIVAFQNNEKMNSGTKLRASFSAEASQYITIENLTVHNLTPQDGGQAEALRIDGSLHVIVRHVDALSLQDTLLLQGKVYLSDCYVEGNVDFIWGSGSAYFEQCELKTKGRKGYEVQARNTINKGYIFVDSKLTTDPGITGNYLGRIEVDRFPQSYVAYINCQMDSHIAPVGWLLTSGTDTSKLQFWEYQSTDLTGAPLDVSQRATFSKQLSDAEATAARDKATFFGDGWVPTP